MRANRPPVIIPSVNLGHASEVRGRGVEDISGNKKEDQLNREDGSGIIQRATNQVIA